MPMPKFKATKWKVTECKSCNAGIRTSAWWRCQNEGHNIIERPNVPFRAPDMRITDMHSKWTTLYSDKMNREFNMHFSKVGKMILGCGVEKGGALPPNQWWMYDNAYGQLGLKWMGSDE